MLFPGVSNGDNDEKHRDKHVETIIHGILLLLIQPSVGHPET